MKKLIYFTIGHNKDYVKLAKICIESLYNNKYDGDILIIGDMKNELLENISFKNIFFYDQLDKISLENSSANKVLIYKYPDINKYEKIIFCDLDSIWLDNPDKIFDLISEDVIYVTIDATGLLMSHEYDFYGHSLLSKEEIDDIQKNKIYGFCCGFFAFNKNMIQHFEKIHSFINENLDKLNGCVEQKFMNVYCHRNNIYDTTKLKNLVRHDGYCLPDFDGVLVHFPGGVGNFDTKFERMTQYMEIKNARIK